MWNIDFFYYSYIPVYIEHWFSLDFCEFVVKTSNIDNEALQLHFMVNITLIHYADFNIYS